MISLERPEDFNSTLDAVGCFIECDGKVLFLQRAPEKPEGNAWAPPGGKVDAQDLGDLKKAIFREVQEETGIEIDTTSLVLVGTFYVRYQNRDVTYHKYRLVLKNRPSVRPHIKEHQKYDWYTPVEALLLPLMIDEDFTIQHAYGI